MLVRRIELEGHRVRILLETNYFPYLIVMEIVYNFDCGQNLTSFTRKLNVQDLLVSLDFLKT